MAALVERIGGPAGARQPLGGFPPGMPRLAAAVEQQHRACALAEHIGDETVARSAGEDRFGGRAGHGLRSRNSSTVALNTLSPTASM